jgi:hypothetical protein
VHPVSQLMAKTCGALDCLEAAGYQYSSSIYPVIHDHYGMPEAPRFAFRPSQSGQLLELPVTTVRMLGRNFPVGGGGYFRFWPYCLSRWVFCKQLIRTISNQLSFIFTLGRLILINRE